RERQRAKERALPIHRAELQVVDGPRRRLAIAIRGDIAQVALALQPLHLRADGGGLTGIEERRHGDETVLAEVTDLVRSETHESLLDRLKIRRGPATILLL